MTNWSLDVDRQNERKEKEMTKKKDEKVNFNEFVDEATREIHSALLEGGSKEMRAKIWLYISSAITLSKEGKI